MERRTWRWYVIRIELAVGTAAAFVVAAVAFAAATAVMLSVSYPTWWALALSVGSFAVALLGTAWMWRIFLAHPEGGAPPWRYRDHR